MYIGSFLPGKHLFDKLHFDVQGPTDDKDGEQTTFPTTAPAFRMDHFQVGTPGPEEFER
jgi:hypothetical protein